MKREFNTTGLHETYMCTIEEASIVLGVSVSKFRQRIANVINPGIQWGNEKRFPLWYLKELQRTWLHELDAQVDEFLAKQKEKGKRAA
jgi:hypothetical protein